MPGTTSRACSERTKVFQPAIRGRGRWVIITVSSMSLTTPSPIEASMIQTDVLIEAPSAEVSRASCHPGASPCPAIATST